jgi:hypothetical protein
MRKNFRNKFEIRISKFETPGQNFKYQNEENSWGKAPPCHYHHAGPWYRRIGVLGLLIAMALGIQSSYGQSLSPAPPKPEMTAAEVKKQIVEKNIFAPARKQKKIVAEQAPASPASKETGLKKLKRPFVVKGVTQVGEQCQAYLYFEEPSEYRPVKVGDVIETIKILEIHMSYLMCDYAGRKVRIEVDEGSNDALARLVGHASGGYYLIGTTVGPSDTYALFFFPGESRPCKYRAGDMVSPTRQIVAIEPGKVILLDQDGDRITVEAGPPPKH